jgi:hypothetical protein
MANDKGVSREAFQSALEDGTFVRVLDDLKFRVIGITPPTGARLYALHLQVKLDGDWQTAVNEAGPNTPSDYNVRKVADQYLPTGTGEVDADYILLNYPKGDGNWDKALTWAKGAKLQNTVPREVFAVGKQFPTLHRTLGLDPMYVVATTTDCTFDGDHRACYVWWNGSVRRASLDWVSYFDDSNDWFLFRK